MKARLILILVAVAITFSSCNRFISPFEAANGKAKCGRMVR